MRIHVVPQPFAQLIARGVAPFDACRTALRTPGRFVIVAPAKAPTHDDFARITRHPRLARAIADQGWTSLADILALPRGAAVGTVEVRMSRPVRAVLLDPGRADRSPDDPIDITVAGGDGRHDPDAFVLPVWPDDHIWMFANAVELPTPVAGVSARQSVLGDEHARAVADGERAAREAALTHRASADAERTRRMTRRRAHAWLNDLEVQRLAREARRAEAAAQLGRELERDMRLFARDRFEQLFQRTIARHVRRHASDDRRGAGTGAGAATLVSIAGPVLQALFPGAKHVSIADFERRLRAHIREVARADTKPCEKPHPLADLPHHLPRLARVVDISARAGVHIHTPHRRAGGSARRDRFKAPVEEPDVGGQQGSVHDPPDPRDFGPQR